MIVRGLYYLVSKIEEHFNCSEDAAEKALDFAFECNQEMFWNEYAQDIADNTFDYSVKVYSAGRSSGWLIVEGLPEFETWDAVMLAKWRSFENKIDQLVEDLTSWDTNLQ